MGNLFVISAHYYSCVLETVVDQGQGGEASHRELQPWLPSLDVSITSPGRTAWESGRKGQLAKSFVGGKLPAVCRVSLLRDYVSAFHR